MCEYVCLSVNMCLSVSLSVSVCVCMRVNVCLSVCVYKCEYMSMHIIYVNDFNSFPFFSVWFRKS